jgi:D-3-phosphoglycerate dehydrogenase
MTRCRIVSRVGTGLDAIDIPAATQLGIWVTNVPDYSVDEVSTHAITLLLAQARRLPRILEATRRGVWDSRIARPFPRLKGQTLGVLGFGRIAQAVAAKGRGLGLEVSAHDPFIAPQIMAAAGVRAVSAEVLWRESDFISLHTPLTDTSRHIVNAQALAQMKPTAYLINTARGPLVDEAALLAAVRAGQIAGAALDVLEVEPPPADHPLLHDDRILITPHYAWYSEAANVDVRVRGAEEVVRVWRGERPRCPANEVTLPRREA